MYTLLFLFAMTLAPIPVMTRHMLAGKSAYRGVLEGSLTAVAGTALVFMLFWAVTGAAFLDVVASILDQVTVAEMSKTGSYAMLGMKDISPDDMEQMLEKVKEMMRLAIPGTLMICSVVITYFNYRFISWILAKAGRKPLRLPNFRAFSLPRNIILGAFIIYGLAFLSVKIGIIDDSLMMFTLEMLFNFVFAVQGLAVVFFIGYVKKIPVAVTWFIALALIFTFFGQTFLFIFGVTDVVMDIRKRFSQTNLKI